MNDNVEMIRLAPPAALDMALGEAMFTQRAIRRLDPDRPVSDEQIRTILGRGLQGPERRQHPARALPGGARPGEDPRLRGALPRGMVGQASRRVRLDRQGRHPRRVAVSDAGPPRRRDGERAGRHPRLLAAFRDGRGVHLSGRPEHPARGALPRDRVGAHHLASAGDGAGVRDVRHPGGHGVPLLHPARLPARAIRPHRALPDLAHHLLGRVGEAAPVA